MIILIILWVVEKNNSIVTVSVVNRPISENRFKY